MSYESLAAPAAGTNLPFDRIQGIEFPRSKMTFGGEGQAIDVAADAPMPVSDAGIAALAAPVMAATSTPLTWSTTTADVFGPFVPQLGKAIYIAKTTADTASLQVLVSQTGVFTDAVPITQANGSYTTGLFTNVTTKLRELIGSEYSAGAQYFVSVTPTAGTVSSGSLFQ
jgi:hypothetical protein